MNALRWNNNVSTSSRKLSKSWESHYKNIFKGYDETQFYTGEICPTLANTALHERTLPHTREHCSTLMKLLYGHELDSAYCKLISSPVGINITIILIHQLLFLFYLVLQKTTFIGFNS